MPPRRSASASEFLTPDDLTDLALLRIESKETLKSVPWGSSGKLRVGQWVLAAGNNGHYSQVTAIHRAIDARPSGLVNR